MTAHPTAHLRSCRALLGALAAGAAVATLFSCAGVSRLPQEEDLHPRLTPTAYIEEGKLLAFAVDTNAAAHREKAPFVPLAVVVADKTLARLSLNRESFTLVDDAGRRYPLASVAEVRESRAQTNSDYRHSQNFFEVNAMSFSAWRYQSGSFFPVQSVERETVAYRVLRDQAQLTERMYLNDVLYFPHPEGTLVGRKYELWLSSPDLPEPVFVKFRVGKKK